MKQQLSASKNVLISLPEVYTFSEYCAVIALSESLKSLGKSVTLLMPNDIPDNFSNIVSPSEQTIISKLRPREIVLGIKIKKGSVRDVKWREEGERGEFVIVPKEGEFEFEKIESRMEGTFFDLTIIVGCNEYSDLGDQYYSHVENFERKNIINIVNNNPGSNLGQTNLLGTENSLCGWIFKVLKDNSLPISDEVSSTLVLGDVHQNEGIRHDGIIFEILKEHTDTTETLQKGLNKMYSSLDLSQIRYIGLLISNLKANSTGIVVTKVDSTDLQGITFDKIVFPETYILSRLQGYERVVVLTETVKGIVAVRVYSFKQEDLKSTLEKFSPHGHPKKVTFDFEGNLDSAEEAVLGELTKEVQELSEEGAEEVVPEIVTPESEKPVKLEDPIPEVETPEHKKIVENKNSSKTTIIDKKVIQKKEIKKAKVKKKYLDPLKAATSLPDAIHVPETEEKTPGLGQSPGFGGMGAPGFPPMGPQPLPPAEE